MEHPDDEDDAGIIADDTESPTCSSDGETPSATAGPQPWPNTAIERQIATTSTLGYRKPTHQDAADRTTGPRKTRFNADHYKFYRVGLASFFLLFLLVAAGLVLVFTHHDRPLQKAASAALQMVDATTATHNPSPAPDSAAQAVEPKKIAAISTPAAVSVPISDVSLRNRPELLEQLVQVYRSQLANNSNDSTALTALNQLQEQSLSELQTIITEGDQATAVKSLEIVSRLFPELTDNTRYKYLMTRIDFIPHSSKDEPVAKSEPSTPSETTSAANISHVATVQEPIPATTTPPATTPPATISTTKDASPAIESSSAIAKNAAINTTSSKPEIRAASITPGTIVEDRFIPSDDGNVFMVEISYRNFDKAFVDKTEATLVARLGVPGDSMVLAEVPVTISADRGTKSFLMETFAQSHADGKLQLNFILNDKFLTSRTLRLSMPGR